MLFELTNSPATFLYLMNMVFSSSICTCLLLSLLMISHYSMNEEEHATYLRVVLKTLKDCQLYEV